MGMTPSPVPLTPRARRKQNLYRFFSPKCNRWIELESFVEWLIWLSHEFDDTVTLMCERPGELIANVNAKAEKYTPDLFVKRDGDIERLIEAKKEEDLEGQPGERVPKRWATISAIAQYHHMDLRVMTDAEFDGRQIAVANWREALPYVVRETKQPNHDLREEVLGQFTRVPTLTLGEVSSNVTNFDESETHEVAFWAIHQGLLSIDWDKEPISRATLMRGVDGTPYTEGGAS